MSDARTQPHAEGILAVAAGPHRLTMEPANDDATLTLRSSPGPRALLRIVPVSTALGDTEEPTRDDGAFEWTPVGETDDGPLLLGPWEQWIETHPEEVRRHVGRFVAIHPVYGVLLSADTFDNLYEQLRALQVPSVPHDDLLLTSFPRETFLGGALGQEIDRAVY